MGLFSWLFPSDEDRLASARALMARGKHDKARKLLIDCSLPEAEALYEQCSAVIDKADEATLKKRLVKEGFRGWKVEVDSPSARTKKELETLVAREIAKAGIDMTDPGVDQDAVKACVARAQRKATQRGGAGGSIKLVPIVDPARRPR